MSLYDDATFIYSGEAAAGAPHRAYTLKPAEKLKTTVLNANSDLSTSGTITGSSNSLGLVLADSSTNSSASIANGLLTITTGADGASTKARVYTSNGTTTAYLESGKSYNLTYTVVENNGVTEFKYAEDGIIRPASTEIGTHAVSFKRGEHNDSPYFYLQSQTPSANIVLKDIIVREAEQRSLDFRVTRGSNLAATRVKADGFIEKGRENLLKYSNGFDNALWEGHASGDTLISTITSGQSGYDGSSNAFLLNKNSSDLFKRREQIVAQTTGAATFSVYARAGTASSISLRGGSDDSENVQNGNDDRADFNLANGTSSTVNNAVASSMEAITGDAGDTDRWYRCSVVFKDPTQLVQIYVNFNSASTGTVFLQDAQLENGLIATAPIESKSMTGKAGLLANEPRYDYLTSTTDCPGALMEPGRTNVVVHSEYFDAYDKTEVTLSSTLDTSPEGVKNAYKILETSATGTSHKLVAASGDAFTNATKYSVSIFAKASGRTKFRLQAGNFAVAPYIADFTLTGNGVATAGGSNDSNATVAIENYGNGWYRCKIEGFTAAASSSTKRNIFLLDDSGNASYNGDTTKGIVVYGFQLEAGPWCSSYIPTYGSSVTRTKDAFVSPVDDSEYATEDFTFFIDYKDFKSNGNTSAGLWRAVYRDSTRSIFQYNLSVGYHGFPSSTPSTPGSEYSSNHATEGANKIALVYNRDSVAVYVDGTQTKLDYSVDTTKKGLQFIDLNYGDSKMTVNSIMVFNRPLTKDEAVALTT